MISKNLLAKKVEYCRQRFSSQLTGRFARFGQQPQLAPKSRGPLMLEFGLIRSKSVVFVAFTRSGMYFHCLVPVALVSRYLSFSYSSHRNRYAKKKKTVDDFFFCFDQKKFIKIFWSCKIFVLEKRIILFEMRLNE